MYKDHENSDNWVPGVDCPGTLSMVLEADIPENDYIINPLLPKGGKLMISALQGSCKTFFILNLACSLADNNEVFLNTFSLKKDQRVLCVLAEGGASEMKRRLSKMVGDKNVYKTDLSDEGLFPIYESNLILYDEEGPVEEGIKRLNYWIKFTDADIVVLDPIGEFFRGNEISKMEVSRLLDCMDELIQENNVSFIFTHHWRKPSKGMSSGGHMASGSYAWSSRVDGHITLEGNDNCLKVTIAKVRCGKMSDKPTILKLNEDTFWLEYQGECELNKKFVDKEKIHKVFDGKGVNRLKVPELLIELQKEIKIARNTLVKCLNDFDEFIVDKSDSRCFWVERKRN